MLTTDITQVPLIFFQCGVEEARALFDSLNKKGTKQVGGWPLFYASIGDMRVCLHFSVKDPSHTRGKLVIISQKNPPRGGFREWIEEVLGPLPLQQKGDDAD